VTVVIDGGADAATTDHDRPAGLRSAHPVRGAAT
jgi:hypothetical protein